MGIVTSAIVPVLFSTLSRYQNDENNFHITFWKFQKYMAIITVPMSVGIFIYSDLVTNILLGSQWSEAAGFVGLWGLMSGLTILFSHLASEVYRSKGNPKLSMLMQATQIVFVLFSVAATVNLDFETLYTSRALIRLQGIVFNIIAMRAIYKFSIKKMMLNITPAIVSAVIMGCVGFFIKDAVQGIAWEISSVGICIVVYFVALVGFFPKMRTELVNLPFIQKIQCRKVKK
jgi:PST family polysaccharide transporter